MKFSEAPTVSIELQKDSQVFRPDLNCSQQIGPINVLEMSRQSYVPNLADAGTQKLRGPKCTYSQSLWHGHVFVICRMKPAGKVRRLKRPLQEHYGDSRYNGDRPRIEEFEPEGYALRLMQAATLVSLDVGETLNIMLCIPELSELNKIAHHSLPVTYKLKRSMYVAIANQKKIFRRIYYSFQTTTSKLEETDFA